MAMLDCRLGHLKLIAVREEGGWTLLAAALHVSCFSCWDMV